MICFAVMCEELCMHWQLDVNGFLQVATSLHYFCFCLEHRDVIDCTLPVKMCGTYLGVILSVVFIGSASHLLRCEAHTLG